MEEVRLDKYLWAVRAYKTRTDATDACKGGKVRLNGFDVKPSRPVKVGDTITFRKGAVTFTFVALALTDKRVGAKLVSQLVEDRTPQSEKDKMKAPVETFFLKRDRGAGRPTKKDRRDMDALWEILDFNDDEDDFLDE